VPEAFSTPEVAHAIGHAHGKAGTRGNGREELIEILEAAVLALVAVSTAWCGYQTARWDGRQAELYGLSAKQRVLGNQASTRGGQERLYDTSTFSFWLQAKASGESGAAQVFEHRFRPEYKPAFEAWQRTDPFNNPEAPPGPIFMPEYHNASAARASVLEERASATFERGTKARATGEKYLRNTILLATVLFLTALAQRFKVYSVRVGLVAVSGSLLALALYFVATYPRA
jgi:hypothetical protein